MPFRIKLIGPVSRSLVRWLEQVVPVLRKAPPDVRVTVEIERDEGADDEPKP